MEHLDYFKLQAKNLLKDYKTRFFDEKEEIYSYKPKYFDINGIFCDFDIPDYKDDFTFTLMNAQHIIAQLAGFSKWNELQNATPAKLELAHLLFDNAYKINTEEWEMYISQAEAMNNTIFTAEEKLEIFKEVFLKADMHRSDFVSYRIDLEEKRNTTPTDMIEDESPNIADMYDELDGQEKIDSLKTCIQNGHSFSLEQTVECLHCGKRYKFKEVKVLRLKPEYRVFDFDEIVCKYHPECSGTLIDLM